MRTFVNTHQFQSTLPRGERQKSATIPLAGQLISIHAPARGATHVQSVSLKDSQFQSTLPRGERPLDLLLVAVGFLISIHAPARGATFVRRYVDVLSALFQSTLPRGERLLYLHGNPVPITLISIHAPARGATIPRTGEIHSTLYFNPRSREGSDTASNGLTNSRRRFQSTLPRGERPL